VHFFEIPQECGSWHLLSGINPVLHMIFSFMQMYFLFMHARYRWHQLKPGDKVPFFWPFSNAKTEKWTV
jgi:hypothetical protein